MRLAIVGSYARSLINFRGPLIKELIARGHEVITCAPDCPDDVAAALFAFGAKHYDIVLSRTGINPIVDFKTFHHLRSLFVQVKPDCVLSYTIKPVIYGSLAAQAADIPRIYSMITGLGYTFARDTIKQRMVGMVAQPLYRKALRYNTKVFFQNPDDRELFLKTGLLKSIDQSVLINGSGVDLRHFRRTIIPEGKVTFLLIARLLRDKGIHEYVEAARIVRKQGRTAIFRLVGPFDTNPNSIGRDTIEQWKKEGIVEYFGEVSDVRPIIADSSVYVLPSYREGTPRTVLEAMAMGRPIITTDAPGCRETVIDGRNGYLVPLRDPQALAETMIRFIDNPSLIHQMGEESYRIAVEKYDVDKVNAAILEAMGL